MGSATPAASRPRHSTSALKTRSLRGLRRKADEAQVAETVSEAHALPHGSHMGEMCYRRREFTTKSCIAPWEVHYKTDRNLTGTDRCPCQSTRQCDNAEIFTIENQRHAVYWQQQAYPVMLVIRTSDGTIRCTNIPEYLQKQGYKQVKQIVFKGERLLRRFCSGCTTACCRYQTRGAEAGQERAAYVIGAPRLSDWCKHGPYGTNVGLSGCTASRRPSALSRASKLFSSGLPRGESVR